MLLPSSLTLLTEFIQRKRHARIIERAERGHTRQWFLLFGHVAKDWLLQPQPAMLRKVLPPADRAWADPFLWRRGNEWFIFCEEWTKGNPHGHIAVMQISEDGELLSPPRPLLVKDHHLSYPFLFQHEEGLLMIPEGGAGGAIDMYQCEAFPAQWRKRMTLMQNVHFADATLFQHQAKWWMLATMKRGLFALNRDLFAFWADTPFTDQWHPHPANPVVRGLRSARPAGRVFELGGKLYRPSQNCLIRYGHSLRINEIVRLDPTHYQERLVTEVKPTWDGDVRANHHIDWHEGAVVMDAQRLLP